MTLLNVLVIIPQFLECILKYLLYLQVLIKIYKYFEVLLSTNWESKCLCDKIALIIAVALCNIYIAHLQVPGANLLECNI